MDRTPVRRGRTSAETTTLDSIGRLGTAWMIEDTGVDAGPAGPERGVGPQDVRFRCRDHFIVLCENCIAAAANAGAR